MTNWKEIHEDFTEELQKEWERNWFSKEETKEWIKAGLQPMEVNYACWLKEIKSKKPQSFLYQEDEEKLRIEYNDSEYKQWANVHKNFVGINGNYYQNIWKSYGFAPQTAKPWIEVGLKIEDVRLVVYAKYKGYYPPQIKREELAKEYHKTQNYFDFHYPKEEREQIKKLNISYKNLTGELDLGGFRNLEKLDCSSNKLVNCNFLNILPHPEKLTILRLENNKITQDFTIFSRFSNLERLWIYNNPFRGSLEPLTKLVKLKWLDISNTDLNSGVEYLPKSLSGRDKISYTTDQRPNSKVSEIKEQLDLFTDKKLRKKWEELGFVLEETFNWTKAGAKANDYDFVSWLRDTKKLGLGWITNYQEDYKVLSERFRKYWLCKKCRQPNTLSNFCQPCNFQQFQQEFDKPIGGNPQVNQFLQENQLKSAGKRQVLEWISYDKLIVESKPVGEGGFGKVYKAKWKKDNQNKWVALKELNNSQNMTREFLWEIANHKLFYNANRIVNCFGISQNPQTKDYVMVMDYIKDGDLRKFLKNNQLTFKEKLDQLWGIADGLKNIHQQNLTHCDFHSGNILNRKDKKDDVKCYITDLGLSCPVNEEGEGKTYGQIPYVAPEVLQGQPYIQASDIYSFSIVAYELLANAYPYYEYEHDASLAALICEGLRPNLDELKMPQKLKDLIKRCWDADPQKRSKIKELVKVLNKWRNGKDTQFTRQVKEIEAEYNQFSQNTPYKIKPNTITTSRLIDTRKITELMSSKMSSLYLSRTVLTYNNYHSKELEFDIEIGTKERTKKDSYQTEELNFDIETPISTKEITKRLRSMSMEEANQTKSVKLDKTEEEQEYYSELMEIDGNSWQNIHPNFTPKLIQSWTNHNFSHQQTQDWINIGLKTTDYNFCAWLRDIKQVNSEWVLNHGQEQILREEYQQTQAQIEQLPK